VGSANCQASHYICTTRSIILPVLPFTFKYSPTGLMEENFFRDGIQTVGQQSSCLGGKTLHWSTVTNGGNYTILWSVHFIYFQRSILMISCRLSTRNMAVVWMF